MPFLLGFCWSASSQFFYLHLPTIYCVGVETKTYPNYKNEHTKAALQWVRFFLFSPSFDVLLGWLMWTFTTYYDRVIRIILEWISNNSCFGIWKIIFLKQTNAYWCLKKLVISFVKAYGKWEWKWGKSLMYLVIIIIHNCVFFLPITWGQMELCNFWCNWQEK